MQGDFTEYRTIYLQNMGANVYNRQITAELYEQIVTNAENKVDIQKFVQVA